MEREIDTRSIATRRSYDRVAASYRSRFRHELDDKPFDRDFLDDVAVHMRSSPGWLADLGSGPGQIGAYLAGRGLRVLSVDLSFDMLRSAVAGGTPRVQADMRAMPFDAGSLAGVVAFYSLIHIPPTELVAALAGIERVLAPGGLLAVTVHVAPPGSEADLGPEPDDALLHVDEMLTEPVDLDFYFYGTERLVASLEDAAFDVVRCTERDPYGPEVEPQTRRAYVLARSA
jgi:SAM-dependent methyltransferase